jgi:hypothetical protein
LYIDRDFCPRGKAVLMYAHEAAEAGTFYCSGVA